MSPDLSHKRFTSGKLTALLFAAGCALAIAGCGPREQIVPVSGQVSYNGKPLTFGGVSFHPPKGQPARGTIDEQGRFVLSTHAEGDGAVVGKHQVRVTCYEGQHASARSRPDAEPALGKLLIPERYSSIATSGIEVEVEPGMPEVVIKLTD